MTTTVDLISNLISLNWEEKFTSVVTLRQKNFILRLLIYYLDKLRTACTAVYTCCKIPGYFCNELSGPNCNLFLFLYHGCYLDWKKESILIRLEKSGNFTQTLKNKEILTLKVGESTGKVGNVCQSEKVKTMEVLHHTLNKK